MKNFTEKDFIKSGLCIKKPIPVEFMEIKDSLVIPTLEGDMNAEAGDYLIKGIQGEFYSVKKEIFEKTYDIYKKI